MRVLAYYLPQFHETPDNNMWWGKGYTEWVAVREAKPLYPGHNQPKRPLEGYYDLSEKQTMIRQSELLNDFGLDGICIYHYYFADSRKTLEKPAENLLKWKDIPINYCFSWASESWVRSWSKFQGNSWNTRIDKAQKEEDHYLIRQNYGDRMFWKAHFDYLLPFFKDERYIKENGKPVLVIYHPDWIGCMRQMGEYWNKLAIEAGFPGLYLIGDNATDNSVFDTTAIHEPQDTLIDYFFGNIQEQCPIKAVYNYDDVWKHILSNPKIHNGMCLGGFSRYDDTPRRAEQGFVIEGASADKFKEYMRKLIAKGKELSSPFVFINAWNEWGEGMYMEPDTDDEYKYLEAIKSSIKSANDEKWEPDKITLLDIANKQHQIAKRYGYYYTIFDKWLSNKERGKKISEYLVDNGINTVGLYGLGMMGKHLIADLEVSEIEIKYGIDKKSGINNLSFPVYTSFFDLPTVDALIITVVYDYEEIVNEARIKTKGQILILSEVIGQIYDEYC